MTRLSDFRRLVVLTFVFFAMAFNLHAETIWDESVNGDLSSPSATFLGTRNRTKEMNGSVLVSAGVTADGPPK